MLPYVRHWIGLFRHSGKNVDTLPVGRILYGSPASLGSWDLGVKSLTGTGKGPQTRPCGFGPPGSYIGTILNVYAAAGSTRTNDFIDNSRPCDHNRKLCGSSHITPKFVTP